MKKNTQQKIHGIIFTSLIMIGILAVIIGANSLPYTQTNLLNFANKELTAPTNTTPLNSASSIDRNNNSIITWESVQDTTRAHSIFFKKLNFDGETYEDIEACNSENPIQINLENYSNNYLPSVASDNDGNFTIVWQATHSENGNDILMQRFDHECNPIDSTTIVNTTLEGEQLNPSITMNPATKLFVITWESEGKIIARRGDAEGAFLDGLDVQINDDNIINNHNPSVEMNETNEFIIIWDGHNPEEIDNANIYLQYFNRGGFRSSNGNQLVNSYIEGDQIRPKITAIEKNQKFIVTWEGAGGTDPEGVFGKVINSCNSEECLISSIEFPVNTEKEGIQHHSSISADYNGNFAITWKSSLDDQNALKLQRFNAKGSRYGQEEIITPSISGLHHKPSLAMNFRGDYIISWNEEKQLNFQSFISPFYKKGLEYQVNSFTPNTQHNPQVASTSDGSRTVIVWEGDGGPYIDQQGIYFSLYDKKGDIINDKQGILTNKYTIGSQNRPQVAMFDNGEFVVCWDGEGPQDKQGIFYQKFNSDGTPNETLMRANQSPDGPQFFCDIAASPKNVGTFAIAWDGEGPQDKQGVSVALFENYDPKDELLINNTPDGFQGEPSIAMSSPESIVVTWTNESEFSTQNIFGQQLNIAGELLGDNFLINENTSANQQNSSITFGDDNNFFVAWHEISTDENQESPISNFIKIKRYQFEESANPTTIETEFTANTNQQELNSSPSISADNYNNFIVSWTNQDEEIFFKAYSTANGLQAVTPELRANSTLTDKQYAPDINLQNSSSSFTIVWTGQGTDDNHGIYAQNYNTVFDTQDVFLSAVSEQEIVSAGRSLSVPEIAELTPINASIEPQENKIIFKNNDPQKPAVFEIKDLLADENPYNISIEATDMIFENDGKTYISASSFMVKNSETGAEIETIRGTPGEVALDETTNEFTSLIEPQILAIGRGENFGVWQFLPELKLNIPELTPPGKHTGGLIFSLN